MSTLYASFVDAPAAEKAAAALLDHGARAEDISILANNEFPGVRSAEDRAEAAISEQTAKSGITTTTAADAGLGAAKGTMVGLGIGIAAASASRRPWRLCSFRALVLSSAEAHWRRRSPEPPRRRERVRSRAESRVTLRTRAWARIWPPTTPRRLPPAGPSSRSTSHPAIFPARKSSLIW
jgi:hypothetical protein